LNLYDKDWDVERSFGGARMRMMHVGRPLGGELLGATVFELEAGVPGIYHFHHGNEEWALVLDGTLTIDLGDPPVRHEVGRGGVVVVESGTALQLRNAGDGELVLFIYGAPPQTGKAEFLDDIPE